MIQFKKKTVVIEAVQYIGEENLEEILGLEPLKFGLLGDHLVIVTLEGKMEVSIGDWVIKGVKGEFYPCKLDIFEMTYEKVE